MASAFINRWFRNPFLSPRISRANMKKLAAYTLNALETPKQPAGAPNTTALAAALRPLYQSFDENLGSGATAAARQQGGTISAEDAFEQLRSWPAEAARRFILPKFTETTAVYREFFPEGRSAFSQATRKSIVTDMRAFIAAGLEHAPDISEEVATTAQSRLDAYLAAEQQQGQAKKAKKDGGQAIKADQRALAVVLLRCYATLLAAFADNPEQAATYFDLSMLPSKPKAAKADKAKLETVV
ncbi:hypothetical protein [Hymenobacter sp. CRA2]|uniref:hypothetical protein n=1 Tax=Hymenobacter sp. CRA2 TaxID=1955620 RepID=UPI00098EFBBD|nr:hypothetical protein [Hymenobacter sp. CRA2]OON68316.1 hypothetical protein B0919_14290 [Hymenobacter sp. CRA2]